MTRVLLLLLCVLSIVASAEEPFRTRGYYITFMRMPVMGLPEWKQATDARDSLSGVNLDEEVTTLIQVQKAFDASARIITVTDRMLDTLLGIVR